MARRGDGLLAVAPLGSEYDPEAAVAGPLRLIRRTPETEGRDPASVGAVPRVNPTAGHTPRDVADVILRTRDETDVDHAFVDLVYQADQGVDQALELALRTLELAR